jgi:uncharacterized phiE125 gp8 family phage protein
MNLTVVTPPVSEPVSLATAKLQVRVDGSVEDTILGLYLSAARERCEEISRRAFAAQTLRLTLDEWPDEREIKLPRPPLQSVTSVKYTDSGGVEHTFTDYVVDTDSEPGRIALNDDASWPSDDLRPVGGIKITYVAGYSDLPKRYQAAVLLLMAHLYENREATTDASLSEIPLGVSALLLSDKGWYG